MSKIEKEQCAVYLITDNPSRYRGDFLENIDKAIAGGVTLVQYRDKESSGQVMYERCLRLKHLLEERRVPLIVNNDPGLALAVRADGVHVGHDDMPVEAVRRAVGSKLIVGLSTHNVAQAKQALELGADMVGVGPVYDATGTKADAEKSIGLEGARAVVEALNGLPSVAIGGVTMERAPAIYETGVSGVCAVSAFSRAEDPEAIARIFKAAYISAQQVRLDNWA